MSTLLDKSKKYKQAADNLRAKKLYCPEAHCRYYSCLQWMLHVKDSYPQIVIRSDEPIHKELIQKIVDDILGQTKDKNTAYQFRKKINRLKQFRVQADYKGDILSEQEAKETETLEVSIKDILTEVYGTT